MPRFALNRPLLAALALLVWVGCAGGGLPRGDRLLRTNDYAGAVEALREEEAEAPDAYRVKRNLGVALLETGDADGALRKLEEARGLGGEKDAALFYYLGRAAPTAGRPDDALSYFSRHQALTGDSPVIRRIISDLAEEKARAEIRQALSQESSLGGQDLPPNTVAVPPYANLAADNELAPLTRGLAVVLMTDLGKVRELRVVERERLNVLLKEVDLATPPPVPTPTASTMEPVSTVTGQKQRLNRLMNADTGAPYYRGPMDDRVTASFTQAVRAFQRAAGLSVDGVAGPRTQTTLRDRYQEEVGSTQPMPTGAVAQSTAPRMGRLLGAGRLVQGGFLPEGSENIQLSASVATVESGSLARAGESVGGPVEDVLRLQKTLTLQILEALGITVTPEEREEIETLPTESFEAFLAYSRALDFEARGMLPEALEAYRDAVRADGGFSVAREELESAEVDSGERGEYDQARVSELVRPGLADPVPRLVRTGVFVGLGPGPDLNRFQDLDPADPPVQRVDDPDTGTIVVEGDIPGRNQ